MEEVTPTAAPDYKGLALGTHNHPLRYLCEEWLALLKRANDVKEEQFGQYAREAMKFFDSAHNFMWREDYAAANAGFMTPEGYATTGFPTFRMTQNRVHEAVALLGPALYHRNPNITVTPYTPPALAPEELGLSPDDPALQAQVQYVNQVQQQDRQQDETRAKLKQYFSNRLQQLGDKKSEARWAVDEAIIKGMGLMETVLYQPPHSEHRFPVSRFLSVEDFQQDPDAKYRKDRQWIAIRRIEPVNLVERKFGYPPKTLRGNIQSIAAQNTRVGQIEGGNNKRLAQSYDLMEYWEIYSKNGMGQRLKSNNKSSHKEDFDLEPFGDYCYIVVAKDVPFPLNLPSNILGEGFNEDLYMRAQWPVPYWTESGSINGWPVSELTFYDSPEMVWPISLIKPGIGELRFINWCMSYLADKVAANCTTYIGVMKSAVEEIKQQLLGQYSPNKIIEVSTTMGVKNIQEVISFLQAPDFSGDIWKMLTEVMEQFDKRVGLTEMLYGLSSKQLRSATEADVKNRNVSIRPDEMANRVENWASNVALKEIECAVFLLDKEDFLPFLGEIGASVFEELVLNRPFDQTVLQFDYRVEEGSARKPNKEGKAESLNQFFQVAMPLIQEYALAGINDPWNAVMEDYCVALDLDPTKYLVHTPIQSQQGPSPEEQQMAQEQHQMDMEAKQADVAVKQQKMQLDAQQAEQKMALEVRKAQLEAELEQIKLQQEGVLQAAKFQQDAALKQQEAQQNMMIEGMRASNENQAAQQDARQKSLDMLANQRIKFADLHLRQSLAKKKASNGSA